MPRLNVHLLPYLVAECELADATVVVIDVLRATTTITYALAAGAAQVIPCLEIEDARRAATKFPRGDALLGGERGGVKIEGFDLGNSPDEYTPEVVKGRSVVFTTTNGTRAMMRCRQAKRVLIGSFVNLTAVSESIHGEENVHLVCAGTEGHVSFEDSFLAGWIVSCRNSQGILTGFAELANDSALIVPSLISGRAAYRWYVALAAPRRENYQKQMQTIRKKGQEKDWLETRIAAALESGLGGRNVAALQGQADLLAAAQIDKFDFVPELDLADWSIRRPSPAR